MLIFLLHDQIFSQDSSKVKIDLSNILLYPFIFYSPETNLALGGGGIYYVKSNTQKPSKITFTGFYTVNNQFYMAMFPEIYFDKGNYYAKGLLSLGYFIDKFYGTGSNAPRISEPDYKKFDLSLKLLVQKKVLDELKIGLNFDIKNVNIPEKSKNKILLENKVPGQYGGFTFGLGYSASYDSRDNIFFPSSGIYFEFESTYFLKTLGSDFNFNRYFLNLRKYLSRGKNIIALQIYTNLVRGYPPFYELARLGGDRLMRGYYQGRFRDKNYYTFQVEYRRILYWRVGIVVFAGIGDVAARIIDYKFKGAKYSYGFGFRYVLDEKDQLNVRADFGFGTEGSGIYFGIEEAF